MTRGTDRGLGRNSRHTHTHCTNNVWFLKLTPSVIQIVLVLTTARKLGVRPEGTETHQKRASSAEQVLVVCLRKEFALCVGNTAALILRDF